MSNEEEPPSLQFVIVDDVPDDRTSLVSELEEIFPETPVVELASTAEMACYLGSGKPAGALFLDLNLHGVDSDYSSEGLLSLYDWWEERPDVPVCVVSGLVRSSEGDLLEAAFSIPSLVDALDKLSYETEDVRRALNRAEAHRHLYRSKLDFERLMQEKRRDEARSTSELREASREHFDAAFSGTDWKARIKAEYELRRRATLNGIEIFRKIEGILRRVIPGDEWRHAWDYAERFDIFVKKTGAASAVSDALKTQWRLRNKVIHDPFVEMSDTDALRVLKVFEQLREIAGCAATSA